MVANMKLVAVCPLGNELYEVPSGLGLQTVYFIPLTAAVIMAAENASDTNMRPHELVCEYPGRTFSSISTAIIPVNLFIIKASLWYIPQK